MTLEELLELSSPPPGLELSREELTRFFWKYKGLVKQWERAQSFWATTNDNLKGAYVKLDEQEQELARAYGIIQDDLLVGSQVQQALLPRDADALGPNFEVAIYHKQLTEVGGDYYDYFRTGSGNPAVGVFDISGHGVSAALVMAYLKAQFVQIMDRFDSPREIVEWVNNASYTFLRDVKKYATVNFVVFREDHIAYVAGGGFGLLVGQGKSSTFEKGQHFLGLRTKPFSEATLPFKTGDLLALYTDGIIEAQNSQSQDYTIRRLNNLIESNAHLSCQEILDVCLADYTKFREKDSDDITLLILRKVA